MSVEFQPYFSRLVPTVKLYLGSSANPTFQRIVKQQTDRPADSVSHVEDVRSLQEIKEYNNFGFASAEGAQAKELLKKNWSKIHGHYTYRLAQNADKAVNLALKHMPNTSRFRKPAALLAVAKALINEVAQQARTTPIDASAKAELAATAAHLHQRLAHVIE